MKNLINFAKEIGGVYNGYNDGNMSNINHFYHGKGKCERIQQQKIGKMERNHNISRKKINELHPNKVIFFPQFQSPVSLACSRNFFNFCEFHVTTLSSGFGYLELFLEELRSL